MSEKATLLTSIPKVQKAGSDSGSSSNLDTPTEPKNTGDTEATGKVSLLSQTREAPEKTTSTQTPSTQSVKTSVSDVAEGGSGQAGDAEILEGSETVASQAVADEPITITPFQFLTYASFVLNFILAGAAAVILFRKASKLVEERFVASAKVFATASVLIMLHGFFATYLYSLHLNDAVSSAPLFLTMAVWVLVGPAVGFISRHLLARTDKPNRKAAFVDACIYGLIFFLTACGVSSGIKTNAALVASILAAFLMIIPIARSLSAYKVAKARHRELGDLSNQIMIYGLLFLPALLPILAFAHVCGLGDAVTLFLINFITIDFVLVVGLTMIAAGDSFVSEEAPETATAAEVQPQAQREAQRKVVAAKVPERSGKSKSGKVVSGNPSDPIIQFLNGEGEEDQPAASAKSGAAASPKSGSTGKSASRPAPPRKPGRPGITPPKKPGAKSGEKSSETPSRIKAPAKPKKRF